MTLQHRSARISGFAHIGGLVGLAKRCVVVSLLTIAVSVFPFPVPGWASDAQVIHDIDYLGTWPPAKGDLYLPEDAASHAPRPAVVVIHGGAWQFGSKNDPKVRAMAALLQAHGYVAFAINYRLSTRQNFVSWPQNLMDCKVAVRWLRANAPTYRIASDRIGAVGFSAGGQLAAMLAVTGTDAALAPSQPYAGVPADVAAAIDFYGPVVIRGPAAAKFDPDAMGPQPEPQASPMSYVRRGLPPIMIVYGSLDNRMQQSDAQNFTDALDGVGVPHKLVIVEGAGHGFNPVSPETNEADDVLAFLAEHLGSKAH